MKKLLIALITLVMLAGCTAKDFNIDFKNKILRSVKDACDVELPEFSANNSHKEFYNYYLFQGIGRKEIDEISNIFVIYDNEAVLNLDVAGILSRSVYSETDLREIESFESKSLKTNGTCKNSRGIDMAYHIEIKVISETAFIIMQTNQFVFTASCPILETDETVYEMMKTLRTCSVDTNKVIDTYSNIDSRTYSVSTIKLFKEVLPESGKVIDYMDDWKNDPSYTTIDREARPSEVPSASDIGGTIFDNPDGEDAEGSIQFDEDDTIPIIQPSQETETEENGGGTPSPVDEGAQQSAEGN